jgi:hypothetical protein
VGSKETRIRAQEADGRRLRYGADGDAFRLEGEWADRARRLRLSGPGALLVYVRVCLLGPRWQIGVGCATALTRLALYVSGLCEGVSI